VIDLLMPINLAMAIRSHVTNSLYAFAYYALPCALHAHCA